MPQEPVLFNAAVSENIAYGAVSGDMNEIRRVAHLAQADEFIERLPEGYRSRIGERGSRLSGGQRQRLAIARAIFRDAPIVLLDEPFRGLDVESEELVCRALEALLTSRTTFVIAHRLSTLLKADRVIMINDGRIEQEGSPRELIESNGRFRDLAELQLALPAGFLLPRELAVRE